MCAFIFCLALREQQGQYNDYENVGGGGPRLTKKNTPGGKIPPGVAASVLGEGQTVDAVDHGPLLGIVVGMVAGELALAVEGGEDHAVAAVHTLEQRREVHRPVAVDPAVVGAGHDLHVAGLVEAGPQAHELAVMTEDEGTIGDIFAFLAPQGADGGGVACLPQLDGLGNKL